MSNFGSNPHINSPNNFNMAPNMAPNMASNMAP